MFKNYLIVTFRSLRKSVSYSIINIAGLSVGIACTLLILLWVNDEISFNRFLPKANRLYQVRANVTYDGKVNTWGAIALPAYDVLKTTDPRIVNTCAVDWGSEHLLSVGENSIRKSGYYATEEFLGMFEFPLLTGNPAMALHEPGSIVLSASAARALFGSEDPINKMVKVDNQFEQKVTAIAADAPKNSSFQFDCLLPWSLYEGNVQYIKTSRTSWESYSFGVYVELDHSESVATVNTAIRDLPGKYVKSDGTLREFFLYPLTQWRLYSIFDNGVPSRGGIEYVRLFTVIAAFILLMACINFMNLATARSERRAKEVGIRKSVGSSRWSLVMRFIGESLTIAILSFIIGVLLTQAALPFYNNLVMKQLTVPYANVYFWLLAGGLIFVIGIISGAYPAFYLSSFRPAKVLKGKVSEGKGGSLPRKVLVTLQFGFSILLIMGTVVVYRQIQYVKERDLGYDRENLITIAPTDEIRKHYRAIKEALLRTGVVRFVTKSNSAITNINSWSFIGWPGKPEDQKVMFSNLTTEYDYTSTMGIKLLAGRDFSEDFKSDSSSVIINQAALDLMGLKDPIGQQLTLYNKRKLELIGVVENTIMGSPTEGIGPMFIQMVPDWFNAMTVRLEKTEDLQGSLRKVEGVMKKFDPAYPFEYTFADVEFQKKYNDMNLIGHLANVFALLAILITGLGLFGLASFTAEQRTKEIGIRKVLGASVSSLVSLMSKDFTRLVVLAFVLAAPVAWWSLNNFLEKYSYRTSIPWWVFPLTGFIALAFAILIVSTQAIRAAGADPVKSLRTE